MLSIGEQQKEKVEHISFWHIDRKKVRRDGPIEYFIPTEVGKTFRAPEEVMAIKVSYISVGGRKGVGFVIHWRTAKREGRKFREG